MNGPLTVASLHFGSGFGAVMVPHLKKQVPADQDIIEFLISDPSRKGLLKLLERTPRPCSLIGISIRPDPEIVASFRSHGIAVVLIDEEAEGACTIACDNLVGGLLAGQYVACLGRRNPVVVCGKRSIAGGRAAALRVTGFERALATVGLSLSDETILEVEDYTRKGGCRAMVDLLNVRPMPDTIFCAAGDLCATGMVSVARQHLRIPEELSIIGFDDHPVSGLCEPPLTTIRQPLERMAVEAYRLATLDAENSLSRPQTMLLEPELVVRRSA